jgi:hypothetical protein
MTLTAELEIVWRNPKPPQRQPRWEQISQDSETAQYQAREYFSNCYRESLHISEVDPRGNCFTSRSIQL